MTTFRIATDYVAPSKWVRVRIHPTVADLQAAAHRLRPWQGRAWWEECWGCFHPVPVRVSADGSERLPANGFAGTLRLAEERLNAEVVGHELVHAACCVYRMTITPGIRLGYGSGPREEDLAYIYGELYASLVEQFHKLGLAVLS